MKNQTSFALILFLFTLFACSPSAEEIAIKEKAKQDSITIADYKAADEAKKTEEALMHATDSAADALLLIEQALQELQASLIELKAELEAEQSAMSRIKEYQFGRAQWEKEEQIKKQSIKIQTLEKNIKDIEKRKETLESYQ